ncbi:CAP domain-containing protein [Sporomusa malonica]|nr:CAP domain-containing protein [Sporomusa malonica]
MTKIVFGLVIMSLVTTSFGGALATAAYAAPAEEESIQDGDNKAVIGGLVALGLLAVLAGGKKGGGGAATPKSTDTTTTPTTPSTTTPSTSNSSSTSGLTADEAKAFKLLNADRAANGLPALKVNMSLVRLAENYAQDMINRKYFSHYNPEGQSPFDRMKQAGISYRYAGENLAINSNVTAAEKAFMNSSGHRANILSPNYTEVGVGVRYDSAGSVYVVQEFIAK